VFIRNKIPFICYEWSRPYRNRKWILKICHKWHRSLVRTCPYPIWIRRRSTDLSFDLFSIMTHMSQRHFSRGSCKLLQEDDRYFRIDFFRIFIFICIILLARLSIFRFEIFFKCFYLYKFIFTKKCIRFIYKKTWYLRKHKFWKI